MSTGAADEPYTSPAMVWPFPEGGSMLRLAYRELNIAATGDEDQVKALGALNLLPRPWDPSTCRRPELREELWQWLEEVVAWFNREYVWDLAGMIPQCWPEHPHLVREIAVLADQRRRAGMALNSDAMEEWHRYAVPPFVERMRTRIKDHCEEGHQAWPARSRFIRQTSAACVDERQRRYSADVQTTERAGATSQPAEETRPRLASVNLDTGEIADFAEFDEFPEPPPED